MRRTAPIIVLTLTITVAALAGGPRARGARAADGELLDPAALRDLSFRFRDADWEAALQRAASTDDYIKADLDAAGERLEAVGVRIKGNSSSRAPGRKEPLNLGLDAYVEGQRLAGYDTLNLNNLFVDPTLVREVLTYQALRPYLPVPRATFARMHANGAYFGLYALVEQVEKTYLRQWFPSAGGILFKADPPAGFGPQPRAAAAPAQGAGRGPSDLTWLGEDLARYQAAYELKTADAGPEAWEALRELSRLLDAPVSQGGVSDAAFPAAVSRQLDVDGALWYLAAQNLVANFDSYYSGHNYFLYQAPEDGRFHVLSWDMNESFGVFRAPDNTPITSEALARVDPFLARGAGGPGSGRPLLRRLLAVPAFRADYLAHYRTLLAEVLDPPTLTAGAQRLQDLVREAARTDPNLLYPFDLFERGLWEDLSLGGGGGPGGRPVPGLLKLASLRAAWLAARPDLAAPDLRLVEHRRGPDPASAGSPVQVAIQVQGADMPSRMTLVTQVDGGLPVSQDMQPGDLTDFATIPGLPAHAVVRYYARAELADGRAVFFPAANWTQPWSYTVAGATLPGGQAGALVINELQADNETTIADPAGAYEDWLELTNRGDAPLSLAGYFLSDDAADAHQFALPDQTLAPGAHLLIWCDNDPEEGPDHATFKLNKDGDTVLLSTATETVDSVTFGVQAADHSHARLPDGAEAWVDCGSPSPGAANHCGPAPTTPAVTPPSATPTRSPTPTATPTGPPPVLSEHVYLPWAWRR